MPDDTRRGAGAHPAALVPERDPAPEYRLLPRRGGTLLYRWHTADALVAALAGGVAAFDRRLRCVGANPAMARWLGAGAPGELRRRPLEGFLPGVPGERLRLHVLRAFEGEAQSVGDVAYPRAGDGATRRWALATLAPLSDGAGRVRGLVLELCDVTRRRRREAAARRRAHRDPLTRLPNRIAFMRRLERLISGRRAGDGAFSVLYLDLDGFKGVNDAHGHLVGDAVLARVAALLGAAVRPGDTVARLGGDEFAVLLEGIGEAGAAMEIATRLARRIGAPMVIEGREVVVAASVGVAVGRAGGGTAEALVRAADAAMYRAKSGRPRRSARVAGVGVARGAGDR